MEELRNAVIRFQADQRELFKSEDAIKGVINCHSENMEKLKNLALALSKRVGVLEEMFAETKAVKKDDLVLEHSEQIECFKTEVKNLEHKIGSVEENLVEGIKSTAVKLGKKISESIQEQKQERLKIKELVEDNERKMREVEINFEIQKEKVKKTRKSIPL